ncbi:MAG: hypothetical protein E7330_07435 [Clostridiales bacterium]|nr:hypothetical protein [Clostridiales bacterium]
MRCYKRRFYNGRSLVARVVDFVALRIIILAACYLWFITRIDNTVMAAVLSFTALAAISVAAEIIKSMRLARFIDRERVRVAHGIFRERLLILPRQEFLAIIKAYLAEHRACYPDDCLVFITQSAMPVNEDTVLKTYRTAEKRGLTAAVIFSAAPAAKEALAIAGRCGSVSIGFVTPDALLKSASATSFLPTPDAVDEAILSAAAKAKALRRKTASEPFASGRMRRYILVAAALFALSFFVKYTMYYRMLAALSLSFGALAFWLNLFSPAQEPGGAV